MFTRPDSLYIWAALGTTTQSHTISVHWNPSGIGLVNNMHARASVLAGHSQL